MTVSAKWAAVVAVVVLLGASYQAVATAGTPTDRPVASKASAGKKRAGKGKEAKAKSGAKSKSRSKKNKDAKKKAAKGGKATAKKKGANKKGAKPSSPPSSHRGVSRPCADCHTEDGWDVLPTKATFDHDTTGFPLYGQHKNQTCLDCHAGKRARGKKPGQCGSCHTDKHRGSLGANCASCHVATSWKPSSMFIKHRETRFPLVGAHAVADCTACHKRGREASYRGVATDCYTCHAKDYRNPDVHPNHVTANFRRQCDTCHTQYLWTPARVRHSLFWPLTGAHQTAQCFNCHQNDRYGGTPTDCYGCHSADYAAVTDPPHAASRMSRSCERCHGTTSFTPAAAGWHDVYFITSRGTHAQFDCTDCHYGGNLQPSNFTCTACHGVETGGEHDGVSGYVWENFACLNCHPKGD